MTNQRKIGDTQKVMSPSHFPLPPPNPEFAKTLYNPPQYNIKGIGMNNFGELNVLSEKKSSFHEFMGIGPLRGPIWGTL